MKENVLSIMDLRDIVLPTPVALWPPAPFAWILLAVAGIGLAVLIRRGISRWRAGAYRREGLSNLRRIESKFLTLGSDMAAVRELSVLLKRVALAAFPRKEVAALYGEDWSQFLDRTCKGCTFTAGSGHLLAVTMCAGSDASPPNTRETNQLVGQTRSWIKGHRYNKIDKPDVA